MAQGLVLKFSGLHTAPNPLAALLEGALAKADNVVINSKDVVEPRRGFDLLTYAFSNPSFRASRYTSFQDQLIANYGTTHLGYYNPASGWVDYTGSFQAPDTAYARMKFQEASSNLYFTTSTGVKRLDSYTGTPVAAGGIKALDVTGSLTASGGTGFMSANSQVAYRAVWGIRDANNNLILGSPSQRAVVTNPSGGSLKNVSLVVTVPSGITTSHFLQLYRSAMSATDATEPSDELSLVYEAPYTSGTSLTIVDNVPDTLRNGAALYTNPSQQGIIQANEPPPWCKDIAAFKGSTFYCNTKSKMRRTLTLLAVAGTGGIIVGDTVTIAGTTYTGAASENSASQQFLVQTSGTAAQNIAATAQSLVRVVNAQSNGTVYAYYLSGVNDLPGKMLFEERSFGGATYYVTSSANSLAFNPQVPTSGTTVASSNDVYKHGVYISKTDQPDAAPLTNLLLCGSASDEIVRALPLKDSLFILKARDGIYRVTGTDPTNFGRELFDSTTRILAPETAVVMNNQIWCLSDQGVVVISETGVEVRSLEIEDTLLKLFGIGLNVIKQYAFAIGYNTERKYILFMPSSANDTSATQAFVYNVATNAWTRWTRSQTCGFVNPTDNKLYLGASLSALTNIERKSFDITDYVDEGTTHTIVSFTGNTVTLNFVGDVQVGDLLYQSSTVRSVITAVDAVHKTVTTQSKLSTWTAGSCTVYSAIDCLIQWLPYTAQNAGLLKQFGVINFMFQTQRFVSAFAGFFSELSSATEWVTLTGSGSSLWGLFPFGKNTFGGSRPPKTIPAVVPMEKMICTQLNVSFHHRFAYGKFKLNGFSIDYEPVSTVVGQ